MCYSEGFDGVSHWPLCPTGTGLIAPSSVCPLRALLIRPSPRSRWVIGPTVPVPGLVTLTPRSRVLSTGRRRGRAAEEPEVLPLVQRCVWARARREQGSAPPRFRHPRGVLGQLPADKGGAAAVGHHHVLPDWLICPPDTPIFRVPHRRHRCRLLPPLADPARPPLGVRPPLPAADAAECRGSQGGVPAGAGRKAARLAQRLQQLRPRRG